MDEEVIINIDLSSKNKYFESIVRAQEIPMCSKNTKSVLFKLINAKGKRELEPFHIVLLACLRHSVASKNYSKCKISVDNTEIENFIFKELNLDKYWVGDSELKYIPTNKDIYFNIRKLQEYDIDPFGDEIVSYLKRNYFNNKDLSAVKNSMIEIFRNIFDHADANGIAYSFIKYEIESNKLCVAICDFGKGIPNKIRSCFDFDSDVKALEHALQLEVTTKSKIHNRGFGLDSVLSHLGRGDTLKIISNSAFFNMKNDVVSPVKKYYDLEYLFNGTLIYYNVSLDNFNDEEIDETFDLNF